jgi:hypothetical protein
MKVAVTVAERVLETSGTILLVPGLRTFRIAIEDIAFEFEFSDDVLNASTDPAMDFTEWGNKSGKIILKGYNNLLGVANLLPNIATIAGRQASVGLTVRAIGNESAFYREVSYSVYSAAS